MDAQISGFRSIKTRVMCIFQHDPIYRDAQQDVVFFQAPMTMEATMFTGVEVRGYDGMYRQLQTAASQGAALSCIIDEPNARVSGWKSRDSDVHLICYKTSGAQVGNYHIANCPIEVSFHIGSVHASMPNLKNILQTYMTQGHKISSFYNPPTVNNMKGIGPGFTSAQTYCHMIFEKTPVNYHFHVMDVPFKIQRASMMGGSTVDHSQYASVIEAFANSGWQLAGMIDMPDISMSGFTSYSSTVKIIFQAPSTTGVGGELSS